MATRAAQWYARCSQQRPFLTKSITTSVLFGVGDVLCQSLTPMTDAGYDTTRVAKMAAVGMFWTGPVLHVYFKFLSQLRFLNAAWKMTLFDQTFGACTLTASFYFVTALLDVMYEGGPDPLPRAVAAAMNLVNSELYGTMLVNWSIWPALNYFSFAYLPLEYRVLWASVWGVFWNAYLSYRAHEGAHSSFGSESPQHSHEL
ncbi:PXMP2/4 family protein 2 [Diplonema papillatum]|nr:PXMP2/4 family protein 2 [Diplonema papillatum]KAJ9451065.1 PXMP2/4 family protein 2 [Diplonema papillatum]